MADSMQIDSSNICKRAYTDGHNIASEGIVSRQHPLATLATAAYGVSKLSILQVRNLKDSDVYDSCSTRGMREEYNRRVNTSGEHKWWQII